MKTNNPYLKQIITEISKKALTGRTYLNESVEVEIKSSYKGEKGTFYVKKGTDILHREDGPAVEWADGSKDWYINGERHREDGPAIEYADGDKSWYINGEPLTQAQFNKHTNKKINESVEVEIKSSYKGEKGTFYVKKGTNILHREDGPAVEYADGSNLWYINGELHREDGPATEYADGDKFWFLNGELHREDGPAIEYANGDKRWYINNKLHRENGPAIEYVAGAKRWYINDKLHRENGPAVEDADGNNYWYLNGERHREDGPAVEYADGDKEWYLNGYQYTKAEFNKRTNKKI